MRKYSLFAYFLYWVCSKGFSRSLGRPFKSHPFVKKHHNPMAVKCKIKADACSIEMHGRLQQRAASCHAWIFPRPKKCPPDTFYPTLPGGPFKSRPFVKKHHNPMGCGVFSLSKNFQYAPVSGIIKETGVLLWNNGEKTQEAKQLLWI